MDSLSYVQGLSLYFYELVCTQFVFESGLGAFLFSNIQDSYDFEPGELEQIISNISLIYSYDMKAAAADREFETAANRAKIKAA